MPRPLPCPYCHGDLTDKIPKELKCDYNCTQCGRTWNVIDVEERHGIFTYWLAGYDAAGTVYKMKDGKVVKKLTIYKPEEEAIIRELWEKVKR